MSQTNWKWEIRKYKGKFGVLIDNSLYDEYDTKEQAERGMRIGKRVEFLTNKFDVALDKWWAKEGKDMLVGFISGVIETELENE